jgi:hypothetical protein
MFTIAVGTTPPPIRQNLPHLMKSVGGKHSDNAAWLFETAVSQSVSP